MNRPVILLLVGMILIIIFAFHFFPTNPLPPGKTEVEVLEGSVRVDDGQQVRIVSQGETYSTAGPEPTLPPKEIAISANHVIVDPTFFQPNPLPSKRIIIQDAMQEAIAGGTVTLGTQEYSFTRGIFKLPESAPGEISLSFSAQGYAPMQRTVSFASNPEQTIEMEYLTNYEIQLFEQDEKTPVPNAKIRVWKGSTPDRPIRSEHILNSRVFPSGQQPIWRLQENDCIVTGANYSKAYPPMPIGPFGNTDPKNGDKIVALGNCVWSPNRNPAIPRNSISGHRLSFLLPLSYPNSSKLRIWDTISVSEAQERKYFNDIDRSTFCEILREYARGCFYIPMPKASDSLPIFLEGVTDSAGKFVFKDAPPALYYVQASKENKSSLFYPIHPSSGGANLILSDTSDVFVYIRRGGVDREWPRSNVANAQVTFQSISEHGGLFSASTGDYGMARFQHLPLGEYVLTVNSRDGNFNGNVVLDEPKEIVDIELPDWERYTISGIAFEKNTQLPVADYELVLSSEFGQKYDIQKTDDKGQFTFYNAMPGSYGLTGHIDTLENVQFLPDLEVHLADIFLGKDDPMTSNISYQPIQVIDQNIENIKIPLRKIVKTQLSGIVTYEDGTPLNGVAMAVSTRFVGHSHSSTARTFPENPITDSQGRFSITLFTDLAYSDDYPIEYEVIALVGQVEPAKWVPDGGDVYKLENEKFIPTESGSTVLTGTTGKTYENIHIILKSSGSKKILGKVIAEEEKFDLVELETSALQNANRLEIKENENGAFQIDRVAQGRLLLSVNSHFKDTVQTPFGERQHFKYLFESLDLDIPEESEIIEIVVPLRKAGYLWGVVTDSNDNPLEKIFMDVNKSDAKNTYVAQCYTDAKGFFFLGSPYMDPAETYEILCYDNQSDKETYRISQIKAPQGGLHIKLP